MWSSKREIVSTVLFTQLVSRNCAFVKCAPNSQPTEKVKVRDEKDKEIQILPALSHSHVVRYFGCWVEDPGKPPENHEDDSESNETVSHTPAEELSDPFAPPDPQNPYLQKPENSKSLPYPSFRFGLGPEDDSEPSDISEDEEEDTESELPELPVIKAKKQDAQLVHSSSVTGTTNDDPSLFRTLYIAMQFVDNVSIRD